MDPKTMAPTLSRRALSIASAAAAGLALGLAPHAAAAEPCTKYAAPGGSDTATGSETAPYRSAQKLADALSPGDSGCLRAGTYNENVSIRKGGRPDAPLTLRGYPGERAELVGIFYVARSAPHVTVERLWLNGRNPGRQPSPQVTAADTTFRHNDVTNDHTGICFILGDHDYGRAIRTLIDHNRIHDCGRLPSTNLDHGIYVSASENVQITNNWIYDNADWGVHLYPDAQHTTVEGNIIDGNGKGVIFAGEHGNASNDNTVQGNVIANSKLRFNIESWWPEGNPTPTRNHANNNCLGPSHRDDHHNGGIDLSAGFRALSNEVVAEPGFADRAGRDLRIVSGSRCEGIYSGDNAVPGPDDSAAPLTPPAGGRREHRPVGPAVTLSIRRRAVRRGARTRLKGRVTRSRLRPGLRVALVARSAGAHRTLAFTRVRAGGRFSISPRLRVGGAAVKLHAVVRGVGRSRSVRLRVR